MDAQETSLYSAILITCIVLGIIIVYFLISVIRQQRKNLELHNQNILAEITILEKERARIAADLHDELGPMLSAVKMKISSFELPDPEDKIQMEKTNQHIDDIVNRVRDISYDLMPNTLLRKGFVTALKEFINYVSSSDDIRIHLFVSEEPFILNEQQSINLFRIVQEIIHNTIKHARATEMNLKMEKAKSKLVITAQDNGAGFDYLKQTKEHTGVGLRNILSRTNLLNGQLYLESKKGMGTAYTIEIPFIS